MMKKRVARAFHLLLSLLNKENALPPMPHDFVLP